MRKIASPSLSCGHCPGLSPQHRLTRRVVLMLIDAFIAAPISSVADRIRLMSARRFARRACGSSWGRSSDNIARCSTRSHGAGARSHGRSVTTLAVLRKRVVAHLFASAIYWWDSAGSCCGAAQSVRAIRQAHRVEGRLAKILRTIRDNGFMRGSEGRFEVDV